MYCPLCDRELLRRVELEAGLKAYDCGVCGGHWVSSPDYWAWLDIHGETLPEKENPEVCIDVTDSSKAKICPDCSHILIKYKVGHGTSYLLDHCNCCNGVWFDKNEWEDLKSRNLHDEIHDVFTSGWQDTIRKKEQNQWLVSGYKKVFGDDDYNEIKRIRSWIDSHPRRDNILSYLNNPDPEKL